MKNPFNIALLFLLIVSQTCITKSVQAQEKTAIEFFFAPAHGFYDQDIQVSITADTQYSAIHYTLDGSEPTTTVGQSTQLYQNSISVNKTSVIRAIAVFANGTASDVMTQTYLFVDDIIQQDYQATRDAGFPTRWGTVTPDYGMDPDITNNSKYKSRMAEALLSIPSISIVANIDDLFGDDGIYTHSTQSGVEWERPCSAELIFPDQGEGFQINCGLRIQGGWFRNHNGTKKHSFRLLFKEEYGPTKLRYPLFGGDAEDRFDTIVLRAGANDGYSWADARYTEQYTRDEFGRRLHDLTGNVSPHGNFAHLYINGIYWGLYNPLERPDNSFSAIYHGGDKENWDAINSGQLAEGSMDAWNLLRSKSQNASSLEGYMEVLGNNPDGSRNLNYPVLIDVENYIDYMMVNMWGGNWDWPWKNYRIARDRSSASTGFQFYMWDYENTIGNNRSRSPLDMDRVARLASNGAGVGEPHLNLAENKNYRIHFADRIQKHFFNDGPFTPEKLITEYEKLALEIELAIIPETARWGDQHFSSEPLTQDDWFTERDWILDTYLPQRSDIVLEQFKRADLYPDIDAPKYYVNDTAQHGGSISSIDQISMNAAEGSVYYTTDGTDPRLMSVSTNNSFVIVPENIQKYVHVPEAYVSVVWKSAPGFDVSDWLLCKGSPGGVGYERSAGYQNYFTLDVEDEMYNKNTSCYIRIPFELNADIVDSLASCALRVRYDDGFVAFLNGTEVARKNFEGTPNWDSNANMQNPDEAAVVFEEIDISQYISKLKEGGNILAIHGMNIGTTSSDFLISAELTGRKKNGGSSAAPISKSAVEYTTPFALNQTTQIKSRVYSAGEWSALNEAVFTLPSSQNNIIVSELHYHPLPKDEVDDSEFEFIELFNVGNETQNLSFARFVKGVNYVFPSNTVLRPNDYLVLASDENYFTHRYGFSPFGMYSGQLDNGGERLVLVDAAGDTLFSFKYNDKEPWPISADGEGHSLVLSNPELNPDYEDPDSWRASERIHGEPGSKNVFVPSNQDQSLPATFALHHNYPNPFNTTTTISFEIPTTGHVKLQIYNVLGRRVVTLVDEQRSQGRYKLEWNAGKMSSGIYFYTLTSGSFNQTKQMVLLK